MGYLQVLYNKGFYPFSMLILMAAVLSFGADTPVATWSLSFGLLSLTFLNIAFSRGVFAPSLMIWFIFLLLSFGILDALTGRLDKALPEYITLLTAIGVFYLGWRAALKSERVPEIWRFIVKLFLIFVVWAFVDFIISPEEIFGLERPFHADRLSAAFLSANSAATFLGMITILVWGNILTSLPSGQFELFGFLEKLFRTKIWDLVCLFVAVTCLVLTASRAGIAFTGVSLAILTLWSLAPGQVGKDKISSYRTILFILSVLGTLILLFWSLSGEVASTRYDSIEDGANERLVMFSAYFDAFLARPFFGYGFGSFATVNAAIMTSENAHILATQGAAHNIILQWLLQTGLVGTIVILTLVGRLHWKIWQGLNRRKRYARHIKIILCISILIILHGMMDYALEIPAIMWWWAFLLGFALGIAQGQKGQTDRRRRRT